MGKAQSVKGSIWGPNGVQVHHDVVSVAMGLLGDLGSIVSDMWAPATSGASHVPDLHHLVDGGILQENHIWHLELHLAKP